MDILKLKLEFKEILESWQQTRLSKIELDNHYMELNDLFLRYGIRDDIRFSIIISDESLILKGIRPIDELVINELFDYNELDYYQEVLSDAINTFGDDNQLNLLEEECLELALSLVKLKRVRGDYQTKYDHVIEELADVMIMVHQANMILDTTNLNSVIKFKLERLKSRVIEKIS